MGCCTDSPKRKKPVNPLGAPVYRLFFANKNAALQSGVLAERGGFEPPVEFKSTHDFQSCALDQLSHLSIIIIT